MRLFFLFNCVLLCYLAGAQSRPDQGSLSGSLRDSETGTPVAFANVLNYSTGAGTISNEEGYFELSDVNVQDSIIISFIGYESIHFRLTALAKFYDLSMVRSGMRLDSIIIRPKSNEFLYELISECRKNKANTDVKSKAYYELKSYEDGEQIELVEAFYNLDINDYDVEAMDMKAGRLAIRSFMDRFFGSIESSRALTLIKLTHPSAYFPALPLTFRKRKMKRKFTLSLYNRYLDQNQDSIYVIEYYPAKENGEYFQGKLWINKTDLQVQKVEAGCSPCGKHPFLPLFPSDELSQVDMDFTRTFTSSDGAPVFNHIDFNYDIEYKSRQDKFNERKYNIRSEVLLYAYDYQDSFFTPRFDPYLQVQGDFRKINAMPYNFFFWENNNEYRTNDRKQANMLFFQRPDVLNNFTIFEKNPFYKVGLFEHPYVDWSTKRTVFKEIMPDTIIRYDSDRIRFEYEYNIEVKLFLDINNYNGKINVLTSTIMDPFESYYYMPITAQTNCFINIYFDLCEIMRRKLEIRLRPVITDLEKVSRVYDEFMWDYYGLKDQFMYEVDRGYNKEAMVRWNDYVKQYLDIDNIALFKPYEDEEGTIEKD